jgi:hypothetical protein
LLRKLENNYHDQFCITTLKLSPEEAVKQLGLLETKNKEFESPRKSPFRKKNYSFELFEDSLNFVKLSSSLSKDDSFKKSLVLVPNKLSQTDHKDELK